LQRKAVTCKQTLPYHLPRPFTQQYDNLPFRNSQPTSNSSLNTTLATLCSSQFTTKLHTHHAQLVSSQLYFHILTSHLPGIHNPTASSRPAPPSYALRIILPSLPSFVSPYSPSPPCRPSPFPVDIPYRIHHGPSCQDQCGEEPPPRPLPPGQKNEGVWSHSG